MKNYTWPTVLDQMEASLRSVIRLRED
jgi:hypothetical protein